MKLNLIQFNSIDCAVWSIGINAYVDCCWHPHRGHPLPRPHPPGRRQRHPRCLPSPLAFAPASAETEEQQFRRVGAAAANVTIRHRWPLFLVALIPVPVSPESKSTRSWLLWRPRHPPVLLHWTEPFGKSPHRLRQLQPGRRRRRRFLDPEPNGNWT